MRTSGDDRRTNRLRAVPPLVGNTGFEYRFDVASPVMAAGAHDIHVQVIVPLSGPGQGQIGRQGREALCVLRQLRGAGLVPGCLGTGRGVG
jgi:hypothetical protein